MIRVWALLLCICLNIYAQTGPTIEQKIQHIQDGLLPPVLVEGEPEQTTRLSDRMAQLNVPGVGVAVIHNGKIDWARGFGVTKIGGPPVTPDTLFQAASISKSVTAMAVLSLADAGKLDLDADVNQYLKSWKLPTNSFMENSKVTLRRLLSHTAGTTIHGFPGYPSSEPVPTLVQVLNGDKPSYTIGIVVDTVPGRMMRYSGGGYVVIQQLLEDVTGKPFPQLMQETVLEPAGMRHSTYEQPLPPDRLAEAAMPYKQDGQPVRGGPHTYPEMSAAGLWTTPSDLARFAADLQKSLSGKSKGVLSAEMARDMVSVAMNGYGLGLGIGGSKQQPYFTHGGANQGFRCNLIAYNSGDGAAIMTNGENGAQLADEILRTIAYEYGWPDFRPPERKVITLSPETLGQYVGTYELQPGVHVMITREGNQLFTQITGQQRLPLFAESETKFFLKVVDATHEYIKDDKGVVTHVILRQSGNETKVRRK